MRKVIDPTRSEDTSFVGGNLLQKIFIPDFMDVTKKSLQEKVNSLFSELSRMDESVSVAKKPEVFISRSKNNGVRVNTKIPGDAIFLKPKGRLGGFPIDIILMPRLESYGSNYFISGRLSYQKQSIDLLLRAERYIKPPYTMILFTSKVFNFEKPLSVNSLPYPPNSIGFELDLDEDSVAKEKLISLGNKRIPAHFYRKGSHVFGDEDARWEREELSVYINLNLQKQNSKNHLQCYEIEIIRRDRPSNEVILSHQKISQYMKSIAPEAIWQSRQQHYCLAHQDTFPLLPLDVSRVSYIAFAANLEDPQTLAEILDEVPLTTDGKNQWFANMPYGDGVLSLRSRVSPWVQTKAYLLYQTTSSTNFSARQIYDGLKAIAHLKNEVLPSLK